MCVAVVVLELAGLAWGGVEQTQALLEWIEDLGGGVHGVGLQSIPGMGMGVVTTMDLEVRKTLHLQPLPHSLSSGRDSGVTNSTDCSH